MANDVEVAGQAVSVVVEDLDALARSLRGAEEFVRTYFTIQAGGVFTSKAAAEVGKVRDSLAPSYLELASVVGHGADSVLATWKDFERTDGRARVLFEKRRAEGRIDLVEPPDVAPTRRPPPATRSIDDAALASLLADPQPDTRTLDDLNAWRDFKDGIDRLFSFEWATQGLQQAGVHVPLDRFKAWLDGYYLDLAKLSAGLYALGDYFEAVSEAVHDARQDLAGAWLGETSLALQKWLGSVSGAAFVHAGNIRRYASGLDVQAMTAKLVLDQLIDLVGDLADLLPVIQMYGESVGKALLRGMEAELKRLVRVLSVAARLALKVVTRFELLVTALSVWLTMVTATGSLRLPEVKAPG